MTVTIRLEMEKEQKYQQYHLEKYVYITDEEILPSDQRRVIKQAMFTYSL